MSTLTGLNRAAEKHQRFTNHPEGLTGWQHDRVKRAQVTAFKTGARWAKKQCDKQTPKVFMSQILS